MATFYVEKDPDAVLDYKFDWANTTNGGTKADWLEAGETISSLVWTVDAGLTSGATAIGDSFTSATIWLSGGTAGTRYNVACRITTSASRTDERTLLVTVKNR